MFHHCYKLLFLFEGNDLSYDKVFEELQAFQSAPSNSYGYNPYDRYTYEDPFIGRIIEDFTVNIKILIGISTYQILFFNFFRFRAQVLFLLQI